MSDFTYAPDDGADKDTKPRVLAAQFGDGYEQVTGDGINTLQSEWQVTFTRDSATIDTIESFLDTKAGVTSFTWTPPGMSEIRVRCRDYRRSLAAYGWHRLSATFKRVFAT
ncbi:COG4718 Phage-related protein [uncultured Caudovirales phage]|uniref:COG4718 Phage-related protein n=1 Tax=uncultured Caudovirales phage TaxID=2100421 RepID=A0A6J5QGC3_9CAUD|nr:COG4718 Phage-related protein [uncultured Caudovirales phage]